jgi:hypothetical protein
MQSISSPYFSLCRAADERGQVVETRIARLRVQVLRFLFCGRCRVTG